MNILEIFIQTNFLVQISIVILIGCSIISWSIIFHRILILKIARSKYKIFEERFWSGIELSRLYQEMLMHRNQLNSIEHIFYKGFKEFSKLYTMKHIKSETIISRILHIMNNTMNAELNDLEDYIPLIGIIGSISPYIGLFGTVLGIIHVFFELGKITINPTIQFEIVAPGIAEALISTAIGLFVSIPAIIFFNYLRVQINHLDQSYNYFIDEFVTILCNQIFSHSDSIRYREKQYEQKTSKIKIHDSI